MAIITEGMGTTLTFVTSGLTLNKVSIKAPPIDGGDKIDLTHLGNTAWRIAAARTLKDAGQLTFDGYYDPSNLVSAPYNTEQQIKITYPDGDYHTFWGFLRSMTPADLKEGEAGKISGVVEITNRNGSGVETAPTYTA